MSMDQSFSLELHSNTEYFPYNENQGQLQWCLTRSLRGLIHIFKAYSLYFQKDLRFIFFGKAYFYENKYSFGKCMGAFSLLRIQEEMATSIAEPNYANYKIKCSDINVHYIGVFLRIKEIFYYIYYPAQFIMITFSRLGRKNVFATAGNHDLIMKW